MKGNLSPENERILVLEKALTECLELVERWEEAAGYVEIPYFTSQEEKELHQTKAKLAAILASAKKAK